MTMEDRITLDGARLTERTAAMDLLQEALSLPEGWGRNLDALYDCLTDCRTPRLLEIRHAAALTDVPFGRALLRLLRDAAQDVSQLEVRFEDD